MYYLSSPLIADFFVSLEIEASIPMGEKLSKKGESLCIIYLYINKLYEMK